MHGSIARLLSVGSVTHKESNAQAGKKDGERKGQEKKGGKSWQKMKERENKAIITIIVVFSLVRMSPRS